jgi:hypothetical protein
VAHHAVSHGAPRFADQKYRAAPAVKFTAYFQPLS